MSLLWRGEDTGLEPAREGDRVTLRGSAEPVAFDVVHAGGSCWILRRDGVQHLAHVVKARNGWWVHVDGRTHRIDAATERRGAAHHDGDGSLVAPMTGKILEVPHAEGARVEAGAVVLVLSAMKMRVELKAPFAGKLVRLAARPGEQVEGGTLLAVIEPEPAK